MCKRSVFGDKTQDDLLLEMSSDNVDPESMAAPQRRDIKYIRDFMLRFGLLSSVFYKHR